jgi:hypothetical protein
MGTAVKRAVLFALALLAAAPAFAADRFALLVTGAPGGEAYAKQHDDWLTRLAGTLRDNLSYPADHIVLLPRATREDVRRALASLRTRLAKDDQLLIVLIGHGTSLEGEPAKFNLVGPDLTAAEWAALVRPIPGSLVFVDTSGGSYPFLQALAGRGRIVLTATDSAAQSFDTVFPEFFIKAFGDSSADADKNGRVSIWEAFAYASAGVHRWFDERSRLPTERALLDDTGAGIGREAGNPGVDGALARATYLDVDPADSETNPSRAALLKRQTDLQREIEALKAKKNAIPADEYDAAMEKLLVELARVSQLLKNRT